MERDSLPRPARLLTSCPARSAWLVTSYWHWTCYPGAGRPVSVAGMCQQGAWPMQPDSSGRSAPDSKPEVEDDHHVTDLSMGLRQQILQRIKQLAEEIQSKVPKVADADLPTET